MHRFLTLHQVSSLRQVSAKCTHAHDGIHFYKKREIEGAIGDLEVPDDDLFFVETDAQVRL